MHISPNIQKLLGQCINGLKKVPIFRHFWDSVPTDLKELTTMQELRMRIKPAMLAALQPAAQVRILVQRGWGRIVLEL